MVETSVIIPVLNGEAYVCAALESVLLQLKTNDEVIVIDDGSTDATRHLVESFGPRVCLLRGAGMGPSAARNLGFSNSNGTLVSFLDHDDLWPKGRHENLKSAILSDPDIDVAVGRLRIQIEKNINLKQQALYAEWDCLHAPSMIGSCLYRRNIIQRMNGFSEHLRRGEDTELYIRLIREGANFYNVDCNSLIYRRHSANMTHRPIDFGNLALELVRARRGSSGTLHKNEEDE